MSTTKLEVNKHGSILTNIVLSNIYQFNNYFKAYYLNKFLYEEATKTDTIVFGIALEPLETHYNKI